MMSDSPLNILPAAHSCLGRALVVNLFGGPGSGKTTFAASLFGALKRRGVEAACPEERAKLALWAGQGWVLDEQTILVSETWKIFCMLANNVDVIISDSPLLLASTYGGAREDDGFHRHVHSLHRRLQRLNIFVTRDLQRAYDHNGRRESAEAAASLDLRILETLKAVGEPVHTLSGEDLDADRFAEEIAAFLSRSA